MLLVNMIAPRYISYNKKVPTSATGLDPTLDINLTLNMTLDLTQHNRNLFTLNHWRTDEGGMGVIDPK